MESIGKASSSSATNGGIVSVSVPGALLSRSPSRSQNGGGAVIVSTGTGSGGHGSSCNISESGNEEQHQIRILNGSADSLSGQNGSSSRSTPCSDNAAGKLFVGGLSWQTTPDKLRAYFGRFGTITDVLVMNDPLTQVRPSFDQEEDSTLF